MPSFKQTIREAADTAATQLGCVAPATRRLYTPFWKAGSYSWLSPMDSDGLLLAKREAVGGAPGSCPLKGCDVPQLLLGVVVQVEEATGATKPNPYGKASVVDAPLGLWVDIWEGSDAAGWTRCRRRLDHTWVLFVTRDDLPGVHANLEVVTTTNKSSWYLTFKSSASVDVVATKLTSEVRGFLVGRGRPKKL